MGKLSEARKRANTKWDATNLKRLSLAMQVGDYRAMRDYLDATGESQNGFINRAIQEAIKKAAMVTDKTEQTKGQLT